MKKKTKTIEVIKVNTEYLLTPVFPAECVSLYLKAVYVLVRTSDGEVVYAHSDLKNVLRVAKLLYIPISEITII